MSSSFAVYFLIAVPRESHVSSLVNICLLPSRVRGCSPETLPL